MVRIRIIRNTGNHIEGHEFDVDDQVARQLVAEGTARIVETMSKAEIVTEAPQKKRGSKSK